MKKSIVLGLLAVLLTVSVIVMGCAPQAPTPASKQANLFFGSTTSTSGAYVWAVAFARVVNKYAPGVSITVVESGATYDDIERIREGTFDGGLAAGYRGAYEAYYGVGALKDKAYKDMRFFIMREIGVQRMYARSDSGIKTWADLDGKKVAGSIPGSLANIQTVATIEALGLKTEVVPGSLADGVQDVLEGKLAAVLKSSPIDSFDAGQKAADLQKPHTAIGYTEAQVKILKEKFPYWGYALTPANTVKDVEEGHPAIWESYGPSGAITSSRLPQDVGYLIAKAIYENWGEIGKAFPASAKFDPIKGYLSTISEDAAVPVHAGVVQYASEKGINVPKAFIPPEYKSK